MGQGLKSKRAELRRLSQLRRDRRFDGYCSIGDFQDGIFECCDHVSPWTKSGCNVDAETMIVGQDWLGSKQLEESPPDPCVLKHGFDPKFRTNRNLDCLLERHFGVKRAACYLTNVFPYIKKGGAGVRIPLKHLIECASGFTVREIQIVSPRLVVCLGLATFVALMRAAGRKGLPKLDEAIRSPFPYADAAIHCVAHTGTRGMNNRGCNQAESDWRRLAAAHLH